MSVIRIPVSQIPAEEVQKYIKEGYKLEQTPEEKKADARGVADAAKRDKANQAKRDADRTATGLTREDIEESHRLARLRAEAEELKRQRGPQPEKKGGH